MSTTDHIQALAELMVRFGANVQPGQLVSIGSEPGKEPLTRAIAEQCYLAGAKFVDVATFDLHVKRSRARHADPDTLDWVPPWYGERMRALVDMEAAAISLSGTVEPHLMDGIDASLLGRDMLPRVKESIAVVEERRVNWTVGPCPTPGWAKLVYPDLEEAAALSRLWDQIAYVCRLTDGDPVAAWDARMEKLLAVAAKLDGLALDALHFEGPGTDLTVGLLAGSRWMAAKLETVGGIVHRPNLPTEEVFTTPDPTRTEGVVTSTKPLFVSGVAITGLRVRFEAGRAVEISAEQGAGTLQALCDRDAGGARLGEVALVDRESRIGGTDTVFFDTLLDENAASHIALGQGLGFAVQDEDRQRMNQSQIHIDFMIGGHQVAVTGVPRDGAEIPLLRDGDWQI
ncbi:MAG: aminopeptidase [Actinomycetota bacterium]|nr:aminopeptidase [Actinomycetota bacterium]